MQLTSFLTAIVAVISFVRHVYGTTKVNQCPNENFPDLDKHVIIADCVDSPCLAKRNTKMGIKLKFKAEYDMKDLSRNSHVTLSGINLPFIGIDGTSACEFIYEADEKTKNNCNIIKGKSYVYIDGTEILPIFPKIKGIAHWGLTDPSTGKNVICIEVPLQVV